jgi:hypothetical protein
VVLDEAYFEYGHARGTQDGVAWLAEHPNLVLLRTFSKAYGLAGARVGYAISHPEVAEVLNRLRPAFNVNSLAQAGALAALADQATCAPPSIARCVSSPGSRPVQAAGVVERAVGRQFSAAAARSTGGTGVRGAAAPRTDRATPGRLRPGGLPAHFDRPAQDNDRLLAALPQVLAADAAQAPMSSASTGRRYRAPGLINRSPIAP